MDLWKAATAPVRGIGWLIAKAREWWLQERAEVEAAYEKEINILRERLSRATDEADRADIEREIREAEDAYMEYLRAKVVTMSRGVVRDRTPTSVVLVERRHLPPGEGEALERAASTWAALEPPRTLEERLILGNAFHMAGDFERSLNEYDAALQFRRDDPEALTGRGMILWHLDRSEEALANFNRSLQVRPDDAGTLDSRGVALADLKRYDEALADFSRSLELRPDDSDTLTNRGNTLDMLGYHQKAVADYNRSLQLRPGDPCALCNRGLTLLHLKRYEEALADLNRSLELRPDDQITLYNRACLLSVIDRWDESLSDLRAAISADPKNRALARSDKNFEALRNDPEWGPKFWELVGTEE